MGKIGILFDYRFV